MNRRHLLQTAAASACLALPFRARAQAGTIRIVVPYAAGGQTDAMSRLFADSMQKTLGRTVITENRPGAAALIATRYVQNAAPDGDTILFHNSGFVVLPMLQRAATYDPIKDFEAVAMTGIGPNFLMVNDKVPARTMPEFLAWAKTQTNGIECANSGINSGGHIAAMLLEKLAGIKLVHIPFKGSAEVTTALITGDVKMQVSVTTDSLNPYIKQGKVRILATATKERTKLAPGVPTIGEFVPGYSIDGWFGILAPAKTPLPKREQLSAAIKKALDLPTTKERFSQLFMEVVYKGPKEFAETIASSQKDFRHIVDLLGLKAE
jgi:tripartite-type tricarboxylate transporter receptor subunit TctC